MYIVNAIYQCAEKGSDGIELERAMLYKGQGMNGDYHADGGDRQLTLLGSVAKDWMSKEAIKGFCFTKLKENICIKGSIENLSAGMQIKLCNAIIEITPPCKKCYPDICKLKAKHGDCLLIKELRFAKVIKSGEIYK